KGFPSLPAPSTLSGIVVMGGPMGVYDQSRFPFLKKELGYIRRCLERHLPALGICLGAQMIARALGARVYPSRQKEIGWYPVRLTAAGRRDPFFRESSGGKETGRRIVFQWHGDTFDLPRRAELLATASRCRHQAFRCGGNVYALQFHLEVTPEMVRSWMKAPGAREELRLLGPRAAEDILRKMPRCRPQMHRTATAAFRAFSEIVKKRRETHE
ncbi:MAG TPA: gamma-glutamyl-gamma-aminobutyrate hydrolase family protein, partial [Elusimicrobiota bacterium]|nr:gamma-glutamyl-gamma-aminobutyrate hydrolase family protein [Elusimicrobiota bacterium]